MFEKRQGFPVLHVELLQREGTQRAGGISSVFEMKRELLFGFVVQQARDAQLYEFVKGEIREAVTFR